MPEHPRSYYLDDFLASNARHTQQQIRLLQKRYGLCNKLARDSDRKKQFVKQFLEKNPGGSAAQWQAQRALQLDIERLLRKHQQSFNKLMHQQRQHALELMDRIREYCSQN